MKELRGALIVLLMASPACAQEAGDVTRGYKYARTHCSECHGVEADSSDYSLNVDAPNFSEIASTEGMTERAIAVWLQTSHPTMPNLMISPTDRDDLAAYIMSLNKASRGGRF